MTGIFRLTQEETQALPWLTTEHMIEVDRAMTQDFEIGLIQMMENAGRNLANLARSRFLGGQPLGKLVFAFAGMGGNGGGVITAARRLAGWGAQVRLFLAASPQHFSGVPLKQLRITERLAETRFGTPDSSHGDPDLILDGIIGYSLHGAPRGVHAELIRWCNGCSAPVLSLDTPSGLDTSSGVAFEPTIEARATMTLAAPKIGLRASSARAVVGELYLADISVPHELYRRGVLAEANLTPPRVLSGADIVRIW